MSWRRIAPWIEVALGQVLILALTFPVGARLAGTITYILLLLGTIPHDPKGFGVAAVLILIAFPLGLLLAYAAGWLLLWWLWFRRRLPLRRFLLAWALSLPLLLAAPALWKLELRAARGPDDVRPAGALRFYAVGEAGESRFWIARVTTDPNPLAFVDRSGERLEILARSVAETLWQPDGRLTDVRFLVARGPLERAALMTASLPATPRLDPRLGMYTGGSERVVFAVEAVADPRPPRITGVAWRVRSGRIEIGLDSEAPMVVDNLCLNFDADLYLRAGNGRDLVQGGEYRRLEGGEFVCYADAARLPRLLHGRLELAVPTRLDPSPDELAEDWRAIERHGLANGRGSVALGVAVLLHLPPPPGTGTPPSRTLLAFFEVEPRPD